MLAHLLALKGDRIREIGFGLLPAIGMAGALSVLVMLQPDVGSGLLLLGIATTLLILAGARPLHLGAILAAALPFLAAFVVSAAYRRRRLLNSGQCAKCARESSRYEAPPRPPPRPDRCGAS